MVPTRTWWIDEPLVMASGNPTDEDLAQLRARGFGVAVSFLQEDKQSPRYDRKAAALAGWSIHSIPIEEGRAALPDQVCEFMARMTALAKGTKVLVYCESGLGRSAFMGAVYWIARGLTAGEAIARVQQVGLEPDWKTAERESFLHEYEKLQRHAGEIRRLELVGRSI